MHDPGVCAAGMRSRILSSLRGAEATKQSTLILLRHGLLRYARNVCWLFETDRATLSAVIAREGGRSSIPEASAIEPRSHGVLDTPPSRSMTTVGGAIHHRRPGLRAGTQNHRPWGCAKALQQRLSKRSPRRMGPGLRRDDVERFAQHSLRRSHTVPSTTTSISLAPGRLNAEVSADFSSLGSVIRIASSPSALATPVKSTFGSTKSMPT